MTNNGAAAAPPRSRRRTCESVPSFNLDLAYKKMADRVVRLNWTDQHGHDVGSGNCLELGADLQLTYTFQDRPMRYVTLGIIETTNGVTKRRRRIKCPRCDTPVGVLYYKPDHWRCRQCHDLIYASQQRDPLSKVASQYDQLMVTAHRDRKEGEHRKTYERRRAEAKAKLAILQKTPHWTYEGRPISEAITTAYLAG